ncbi:MAG TPA: carboxymuconolactone decarboxylase family protein [Candidatus Limnocylindrales bacterium]|nr:carboxymuconolactone decarboxylase family protein [Candidatus Limnocylindrales bacterium]
MPLTPARAALVRLSAAIAAGAGGETTARAREALEAGLSPERVYEAVLQSYLFLGFPRAIEAFFAVAPLLAERGWKPGAPAAADPARWRRDGEELCRRVYGRNYEKLVSVMRDLSPDLAESMIVEGYGKTLSRPGLDAADREVAVVAILTVARMWRQLRSHAIGTVNVGGTRSDVKDAIQLCEPWCGEAGVREALSVAGLA